MHGCFSVLVVGKEINNMLPLFCDNAKGYLVWPTVAEWFAMGRTWPKLPSTVGAIDGASHRFYPPKLEPQELYYSGHRHCIHTQVVVDVHGTIHFGENGYPGTSVCLDERHKTQTSDFRKN